MQQVLGRGRHVAPTCMSYNYHRVVYLDERGTDRRVWCRKLPIGPQVVPFCGLYLESYKALPKRNYLGAYGRRFLAPNFLQDLI